jgi:hypothetical protein
VTPVIGSAIAAPAAHEMGDIFHFILNALLCHSNLQLPDMCVAPRSDT